MNLLQKLNFVQIKGRMHTSVSTVLKVGGVYLQKSVKQLANHKGASKSVVQCGLLVSLPVVHSLQFLNTSDLTITV